MARSKKAELAPAGNAPARLKRMRIGRPLALTPELAAEILLLVELGNYIETVAAQAGISKQTLYNWLTQGRLDLEQGNDTMHARFAEEFDRSTAIAEVDQVARVRGGGSGWQSAAWWLERRFPNRWGRRLAVTGADGEAVKVEAKVAGEVKFHVAEPSNALAILAVLRRAGAAPGPDAQQPEAAALGGQPAGAGDVGAAAVRAAPADGPAGGLPVPAAP